MLDLLWSQGYDEAHTARTYAIIGPDPGWLDKLFKNARSEKVDGTGEASISRVGIRFGRVLAVLVSVCTYTWSK